MGLVRMDELLLDARSNCRAVSGFECWNSGSVQAISMAAEKTGLPVVFQASPTEYTYCGGPKAVKALVDWYVGRSAGNS